MISFIPSAKQTSLKLLADLVYYFGDLYDFPPKEHLCAVFELTPDEYDIAVQEGQASFVQTDVILDNWLDKLHNLLDRLPAATTKQIADETGIPEKYAQHLFDSITPANLVHHLQLGDVKAWDAVFDCFGGTFGFLYYLRTHH